MSFRLVIENEGHNLLPISALTGENSGLFFVTDPMIMITVSKDPITTFVDDKDATHSWNQHYLSFCGPNQL